MHSESVSASVVSFILEWTLVAVFFALIVFLVLHQIKGSPEKGGFNS